MAAFLFGLPGCKLSWLPIDLVVIGLLHMAYPDGNIPAEAQTLPNAGALALVVGFLCDYTYRACITASMSPSTYFSSTIGGFSLGYCMYSQPCYTFFLAAHA